MKATAITALGFAIHASAVYGLTFTGASLGQALVIVPVFYLLLLPVGVLAAAFVAPFLGAIAAGVAAVLAAAGLAWACVMYTGPDPEIIDPPSIGRR